MEAASQSTPSAPPAAPKIINATGRRKHAVARVRLIEGSGKILVNKRELRDYFTEEGHRRDIYAPLEVADVVGKFDLLINAKGGGFSGQAGAVVQGIARCLKIYNPAWDHDLREAGFLTRDSRMKERKKYGQAAARKRYQFSKR